MNIILTRAGRSNAAETSAVRRMKVKPKIIIEHIPGYSAVDHVGVELVRLAEEEFAGRPHTIDAARRAIDRAYRRMQGMSDGIYRFALPRVIARRA